MQGLSRAQWVARFGDRLGIRSHKPAEPSDRFDRGRLLGEGMHGEVRVDPADRDLALKRIRDLRTKWNLDESDDASLPLAQRLGIAGEIEAQARLGNEFTEFGEHVGVMPPLHEAQVRLTDRPPDAKGRLAGEAYLQMPNLEASGYRTLDEMALDPGVPRDELARLAAEDALNRAWAARGGVVATDAHGSNAMALPAGRQSVAPDGSRTQILDAGMFYQPQKDSPTAEHMVLKAQADAIFKGYLEIGRGDVGEQIHGAMVSALGPSGEGVGLARLLASGALSDLAARVEAMTPAAWREVEPAALRFAGERGRFPLALEAVRLQMEKERPLPSVGAVGM